MQEKQKVKNSNTKNMIDNPQHFAKQLQELESYMDQSAKSDAGKLELSLVPTQIIRDVAQVRMYGAKKYHNPDNWKKVEMQRYVNALYRHFLAFIDDPASVDEESGIPHYKHMACNMAFICEMMKQGFKNSPENKKT